MTMLVDHQIAELQRKDHPLATEVPADDYKTAKSQIQAASLDLTIGDIYVPGTDSDKPGGADTPLGETTLEQGHTAVIRTKEDLQLSSKFAGIAFPPASLSLKGLLMTNPGHIDPGYHGPLHMTVINMSRVPFPLRTGDRIMRVLFIPLEINQPEVPFDTRHPGPERPNPISSELLGRLSVDFVDVTERAQNIANKTLKKALYGAIFIPLAVAVIGLIGILLTTVQPMQGDVQKVSKRLTDIEQRFSQQALEERLNTLEDTVKKLLSATTSN